MMVAAEGRAERRYNVVRVDSAHGLGLLTEGGELSERLRLAMQPFASRLVRQEQQNHAVRYVAGLLSSLPRKTAETIAYHLNLDRHGLQHFLGVSTWEWGPLLTELAGQVREALAEPTGVIAFEHEEFAKKGSASVGVESSRVSPSRAVNNAQLAVYLGYGSAKGAALMDVRLFLPSTWARDEDRRKQGGVPANVRYQTQAQLALDMLEEKAPGLPHRWIGADPVLGGVPHFRRALRESGERYCLQVSSDVLIRCRDRPGAASEGCSSPAPRQFVPIQKWLCTVPESAWHCPDRNAFPGTDLLAIRAITRNGHRPAGTEETLVVIRRALEEECFVYTHYLSNAPSTTPGKEFLAVAAACQGVANSLRRAVNEAGLADYEVRTWSGWHHHQTLALIATWLLTQNVLAAEAPGSDPQVIAVRPY